MKDERTGVVIFKPLSDREKWLTEQIVTIAIAVHRSMGPGLLEAVYEKCFCYELKKRNIPFSQKQWFPIAYGDLVIEHGVRLNLLVDDQIIIELKSEDPFQTLWEAQLLGQLRLAGKRLGYILNFDVPLMKTGIRRMINN